MDESVGALGVVERSCICLSEEGEIGRYQSQ